MITEKIYKLRKDLSNLNSILADTRKVLEDAKNDVKIEGKTLRDANIEQPAQFAYYDEIRVSLNALVNFIEIELAKKRATLFKAISQQSVLEYSDRTREKLMDDDPDYIKMKVQKLDAEELLDFAKSIATQFEHRGYALNNLTKLEVSEVHDGILNLSND